MLATILINKKHIKCKKLNYLYCVLLDLKMNKEQIIT